MIACQSSHVIGYELIKNQIGEPSQPIQAARSSLLLIVLRGLTRPWRSVYLEGELGMDGKDRRETNQTKIKFLIKA